jgi:hypothetical protein
MAYDRQMSVRLDPPRVRLRPAVARLVHDVGEMVRIKTAEAPVTVKVLAEDAETGHPLEATVHIGGQAIPANRPFDYPFRAELNEKDQAWERELIWVECAGYRNAEVDYEVQVETAEPQSRSATGSPDQP